MRKKSFFKKDKTFKTPNTAASKSRTLVTAVVENLSELNQKYNNELKKVRQEVCHNKKRRGPGETRRSKQDDNNKPIELYSQ